MLNSIDNSDETNKLLGRRKKNAVTFLRIVAFFYETPFKFLLYFLIAQHLLASSRM